MEKDVKPNEEDPLLVVNKCIESLEKLVNLKTSADRALYVGSIERLQHAVCTEESALRHFASSYNGSIPLLVTILEKSQDQKIRHCAILIIEKMLNQKPDGSEHAQEFVSHGAVDHLLKLIVKSQLSWGDDFVASLYKVTVKIGEEDKKFAVKARFLGVLPIIVNHIRIYSKKNKVLNSIMKLLKKILASSVNATKLSKDGLPRELLHFLYNPKKSTIIPVLDAISEATKTRHAARLFVKEDLISQVLQILFQSTKSKLNASRCKTILKILLHLTQIKTGREKLMCGSTIASLLVWCRGLLEVEGERYTPLVSLVSTLVQRCLPPHPLPVRKLTNPVAYSITGSSHIESDSSEGRNDDTVSLASSTMSSADSGSDSDDEIKPLDIAESQYGETVEHVAAFFQEICDQQHSKNHFATGEDIESDDYKEDFYEKIVSTSVIDLKDLKSNHIIPKTIQKQSLPPQSRKDLQRKLRKPPSESCNYTRERHSRSAPSTNIPISSQNSCSKMTKKANPSEVSCDINSIPSSQFLVDKNCPFLTGNCMIDVCPDDPSSFCHMYQKISMTTYSVSPFVKLAYPDIVRADPRSEAKLLEPDQFHIRHKIFEHAEQMAQNDYSYSEIYNFDSLLNESSSNHWPLSNRDDQLIYSDKISEHLQFEARFESGNLRKVFWKGGREYDLILNPDINSKSHLQWFYFEVHGMQANCPYVFNIINMEKSTSQFNEGMCPVLFSVRNHVEKKQGWVRAGSNICYFRNHYTQGPSINSILRSKPYYTLSFTMNFEHSNDVCYIAYHYPYTFSMLRTHLFFWEKTYDTDSVYFKRDDLCKTLSGNIVPLLTITAKPLDSSRLYIFLTARVHPGESNSSWVMKGSLDYLLSNKAQNLREKYIFKIVPMLNPDGVINGCHRCSLSGQDLNRQWVTPNLHVHPTIYYTKSLFHYLASKNKKPQVFCDYHGHSRRSNAFFYGCNPEQSWWPSDENKADIESFKVLPILMNEKAPTFSLNNCEFTIERSRESTGRVTIWRQFGVALSYTLECSYGGCNQGKYAGYQIGIPQLEDTGMKLCQCFVELVLDAQNDRVWSSIPIDTKSLLLIRLEKTKSKFFTSSFSTESDDGDDLEEYEDLDQDI